MLLNTALTILNIRDFKIGDYGLPTVGREAFGTGTRQRVLPGATFVALGRYVVEQIHVVENHLQRRQRVRIKGKKNGVIFQIVDLYYFYLKKCSFKRFCLCSENCFVDRFSRLEKII